GRRLQPARVPQRHRVAARQLNHRGGARTLRALAGSAARHPADAHGGAALQLPAARGVRGNAALGNAVPDRLPDCRAASSVGSGHAGAAPAVPARPAARPQAARARHRRAAGAAVVGRDDPPVGHPCVRNALGRAIGGRNRPRRRRMRIAILAPAWFAVPPTPIPLVHTVHGPLDGEPGEIYELIARVAPQVGLISISMNQRKPKPNLNWIATCHNALDFSVYPCKPHRGEYLLFLGRLSPDKGAHRAVAVAMETGLPLKIAGKLQEPEEREYFHELVEPHLVDGIEYLGEVTHGEKVELLQNARATLFPIEWEEPFGLVMIESMACGTPVIATRWGAVPEVIEDGRSGIVVDTYRDMPAALEQADALDPIECRSYVEEWFAPERMVANYVEAYEQAIARSSG